VSLSAEWHVRWRFLQGLQLPNALLHQECHGEASGDDRGVHAARSGEAVFGLIDWMLTSYI